MSAEATAPIAIHASGVVVGEAGIVIRGVSGIGKSSLALALLDAAVQAALFGALIGDDRLLLSASHGRLIARGHPAIRGQIEQRGVGILEIGAEPAAIVRLVVDIFQPEQMLRYPETINASVTLCGVVLLSWLWRRLALRPIRRAPFLPGFDNLGQSDAGGRHSSCEFRRAAQDGVPNCVRKKSASKPGLEFATVFTA